MATTDEYVQYDIRFFEEFAQYLDFDRTGSLRQAVEMGLIQRERLVELAISKVGNIAMDSTSGQDLADTTDVKTVVSGIRNNNKRKGAWMHSFPISGVAGKNGALRVVAYNKLSDQFHYFFIPHDEYQHCKHTVEIVVERVHGVYDQPNFDGTPTRHRKWWKYECASFKDMCAIDPDQGYFEYIDRLMISQHN